MATTELTLESLGLDQEKLAEKLVDRLAQNMLTRIGYDADGDEWFGTSPFAKKLNDMVRARLDKVVFDLADEGDRLADLLAPLVGLLQNQPLDHRVNAAIAIYDNCCDLFRDLAVDAIIAGRSAFWTTASHHSARAYELPVHINKGASIAEALEREYPAHMQGKRLAALDTLIPLNLKAATALSIAYEDFGTWREEPELLARATRDLRKAA